MPASSSAPPPAKSPLTVKQQREVRRAEKVALLQKQQARQRRNRRIGIVSAIVGAVAVVAVIVVFVVTSVTPRTLNPSEVTSDGVKVYPDLTATHVSGSVTYPVTPPVGGNHNPVWLNCGVYSQPVPNENAVHSLEHGSVWVTYDPARVNAEDLAALRKRLPDTYIVLSPYPGISAPVVASAWGAQLEMTGVDDARLDSFLKGYWKSPKSPEPGALCTGGLDAPGRVA